jgi:uncharacterized protein (DUF1501 family)
LFRRSRGPAAKIASTIIAEPISAVASVPTPRDSSVVMNAGAGEAAHAEQRVETGHQRHTCVALDLDGMDVHRDFERSQRCAEEQQRQCHGKRRR